MKEQLLLEEFPPLYQAIAKIIGMENTLRLGKELGGNQIYFPLLDCTSQPFIKARNRQIVLDHNNGTKVKILSGKHNLTKRQIYTILREGGQSK